jgi:hypothetical protein
MSYIERLSSAQGMILAIVLGFALFLVGFWLARMTGERSLAAENSAKVDGHQARYTFLQVGDTVAAIDVTTGEAFAIDGNTRAWTILAPALPAKEPKAAK